jgi:hypothetical protein
MINKWKHAMIFCPTLSVSDNNVVQLILTNETKSSNATELIIEL